MADKDKTNLMCAPGKYDKKNNTCFSIEQLVEMAKAYNRYVFKTNTSTKATKPSNLTLIDIKTDKPYLLKELKKRFSSVCGNSEICITEQSFMNEIEKNMKYEIVNNTFRALGPEKPTEWLSNEDIEKNMIQYQVLYPDFVFLGAVPLDCNNHRLCSLYNLNFDNLLKTGKKTAGIVFNMDKYGESGSHWMAMFINIHRGELYYCDSNGNAPKENIVDLINKFREWYKKTYGKDIVYKYNKKSYQKDGSECGVYSCNFIIRMLSGEKFDSVVANSLAFAEINSCRNAYFRNGSSKYNVHPLCDPKK